MAIPDGLLYLQIAFEFPVLHDLQTILLLLLQQQGQL
jgi:hypothetical protein